ncbi:uncharacterized protein BT62DRAFT_961767 [Guyanagaster necrorhizus]|uniref:Uncharacterized protein n=1 Tax=Guyanagaster necrorhizus TaxID=856835 RepID=A0A9P7W0I4_9AGAR|nr:uncharacterized protein BT62DRAFT_961767 [Guyanagaster necrorhizus MCA 3950]KAG7450145.1 hypothetical protein BT62DRAFT_961767 [Guyanagaster necrorhizus MCA 3950]
MQEKSTSRAWTQEEDDLLVQVMNRNGGFENWKEVATLIPGRTNKACRKRWLHSLCPDLRKSAWTPKEDALLVALHKRHKNKWSTIARFIPGRTDDACSKRFREALDPRLKKDPWTHAEDTKLLQLYSRLGPKWKEVGEEMQRSGLGCRNRLRLLERRASARVHREESSPDSVHSSDVDVGEPNTDSAVSSTLTPDPSSSAPDRHSSLREPPLLFPPLQAHDFTITEDPLAFTDSMIFNPHSIPFENAPLQYSIHTASSTGDAQHLVPSQGDSILRDMELPQSQDYSSLFSPYNDFATFGDFFMNTPYPDSDASPNLAVLDLKSPHSSRSSPMPEGNGVTSQHDLELFFYLPTFTDPIIQWSPSVPLDDNLVSSGLVDQTASISITSSIDMPAHNLVNPDSPTMPLSPSRHYRHSATRTRPRRRTPPSNDTRVSSVRPAASDPNILPYACGYHNCWPRERFATSRELLYHSKTHEHEDEVSDDGTDRLFRCALEGCGKSWKSINGLQYHLQVSPAHFIQALSSKLQATTNAVLSESESFRCPKPGCHKAYKQHGGLRYHLKHGHPKRTPEQLTDVPHTVGKPRRLRQRKERIEGVPRSIVEPGASMK